MSSDLGERHVQGISIFVHGVLAAFHCLGIISNWRRKNWRDVACHTAAAAYDVYAVNKHIKALEECP